MDGQTPAVKESVVSVEVSRLDEDVKATGRLIEDLSGRLDSVLSQTPPTATEDEKKSSNCTLEGRILSIQQFAEANNRSIGQLMERLQI